MNLKRLLEIIYQNNNSDLHLIRLLILIHSFNLASKDRRIEGITKLAKMDFLLRYPTVLETALLQLGINPDIVRTKYYEENNVESKMVRYKYGPWDFDYRRYLYILISKNLVIMYKFKNTNVIEITDSGINVVTPALDQDIFLDLVQRSKIVVKYFGNMTAMKLKNMMYDLLPNLSSMKFGEYIKP